MSDRSWSRKNLIQQVKQRRFENHNGVYVPRTEGDKKTCWPVCMTCHRDVDSVNVEEVSHHEVTIRAKCHNEECVIRVNFPYRITRRSDEETWDQVRHAIGNAVFFDKSVA